MPDRTALPSYHRAEPGGCTRAADAGSAATAFAVLMRVGRPDADQGSDRAVTQAVQQVGADRGYDPGSRYTRVNYAAGRTSAPR